MTYVTKFDSLLMDNVLNFSSFPSNIWSTSDAFRRVMFVAKAGCPLPILSIRKQQEHIHMIQYTVFVDTHSPNKTMYLNVLTIVSVLASSVVDRGFE
jgi:hypothetical protein